MAADRKEAEFVGNKQTDKQIYRHFALLLVQIIIIIIIVVSSRIHMFIFRESLSNCNKWLGDYF